VRGRPGRRESVSLEFTPHREPLIRAKAAILDKLSVGPASCLRRDEWVNAILSTRNLLKRDDFKLNRHHALDSCLSMIFSENRFPLFGIML
jgi:hypothetical protein